jgi:sigma-E factor negative regulatory protein RseB
MSVARWYLGPVLCLPLSIGGIPGLALADEGAPGEEADAAAQVWLNRMNHTLATRNYDGEFLHLAQGRVEKMRIVHRVVEGRVSERLVALTGSGREFVRLGDEVHCYLPDQKKVLVERRGSQGSDVGTFLGTLPRFGSSLRDHYRIELVGRTRSVLGGPAQVLAVTPRDGYRFGYRLWVDEGSGMPVRTDLCDPQGKVVEQVVFTTLRLPERIADADLQPSVAADGFAWVRQGPPLPPTTANIPWRVTRSPPGFALSSSSLQLLPGGQKPVAHLVLSDGLASVSVFIETETAGTVPLRGQGRLGAANAFTTVIDGHQVTAVGEVPAHTVQNIANSVAPTVASGR